MGGGGININTLGRYQYALYGIPHIALVFFEKLLFTATKVESVVL